MFGRKDTKISIDTPIHVGGERTCNEPSVNVHDFGCQLIDDSKNGGFEEGLVVSVSKGQSGKWTGRAAGHFSTTDSAHFALRELLKLIREQVIHKIR